jgi:hypothetical protein
MLCHYAGCLVFIVMLNVITLSVVMPSVIMVAVVYTKLHALLLLLLC